MNRKAARAAAYAALDATGSYQAIYRGPPDTFESQSPVAVIVSAGAGVEQDARDLYTVAGRISVSIYVRRELADQADVEDLLDDLQIEAIEALLGAGLDVTGSDANADSAPLRIIDGTIYRVERIALGADDYN